MEMQYQERNAPEPLKDLIKFFWSVEQHDEDADYVVLPDACFDLIVDYENSILKNIYLTGIWTAPKTVTVTKDSVLFGIRFNILASEVLFQTEIGTLVNKIRELPLSFWNIGNHSYSNFAQFHNRTSTYLVGVFNQKDGDYAAKKMLFKLIHSGEIQRVAQLSDAVGWSSRQMNRYFNRQFGLSLKQYLSITRCCDSYTGIANGDLYPSASYSDQAHFIREIKRFTEQTPRRLFQNRNDRFIQLTPLKKS